MKERYILYQDERKIGEYNTWEEANQEKMKLRERDHQRVVNDFDFDPDTDNDKINEMLTADPEYCSKYVIKRVDDEGEE